MPVEEYGKGLEMQNMSDLTAEERSRRARKAHETRRARLEAARGRSLQDQAFGIEIEVEGIGIASAVGVLQRLFRSPSFRNGVADEAGRTWKVVYDGSLGRGCEIVSPKLEYADIALVQSVVRALRRARARVSADCGVHIHVDASAHDHRSLARLAKMMHAREASIFAALGHGEAGRNRYSQSMAGRFVEQLARRNPASQDALNRMWYGTTRAARQHHYHGSRYHGLNLHAVWDRGTVEFRYFGGTLHAGEVKSYIQFCLAVSHKALTSATALVGKVKRDRELSSFAAWLRSLGMKGAEFKVARKHLTKRLTNRAEAVSA